MVHGGSNPQVGQDSHGGKKLVHIKSYFLQ